MGKTTLAHVVSNELGVRIYATSGPVIERVGDLASILTNLEDRDVLFIDEIHRLNRIVEEYLYSAMEDYKIDIMIGEGPTAKSMKVSVSRFTLVGATTRTGLLTSPLRSRFGVDLRLDYYTSGEIEEILKRSAGILGVEITSGGVTELACRARGTPRIANRLLKRVRDFAEVRADGVIDTDVAGSALEMLEVDPLGLDNLDRAILETIIEKFGRPRRNRFDSRSRERGEGHDRRSLRTVPHPSGADSEDAQGQGGNTTCVFPPQYAPAASAERAVRGLILFA